jgi:ribosomal protein S18 acetylase RimI-like enzyme
MSLGAFAGYREAAADAYAADNVSVGRWPREGALQRAYEDFDDSLPQGLATPENFLYDIVETNAGAVVGVIWLAVLVKDGLKTAFVYDIEVKPEFRRRGYARAAFSSLEPLVRSLGLSSIGLHVFGNNHGAQALYRSLGYEVTGLNMLKKFDDLGSHAHHAHHAL